MNTSANVTANPNNFVVPSFINASYSAGLLSVGVYHMAERTTTEAVNFANAANALNYAFSSKSVTEFGFIARRAFDLIMWEIAAQERQHSRKGSCRSLRQEPPNLQPGTTAEPKAELEQEAKPKRRQKSRAVSHTLSKSSLRK